jgi:hypothetical protein
MPKISTVALWAIAVIAIVAMAVLFAYILFYSNLPFDGQLWWMGLVSLVLALAYYLVYAGTGDRKIIRPFSEALFVIGFGSYYGSIAANHDTPFWKLAWFLVLSILVVITLFFIFRMSRQAEREAIRKSQRRLTP